MKKATAIAHSNIAFIKFYGKTNEQLRIPVNDSISMSLSACVSMTTVAFDSSLTQDRISMLGETLTDSEKARISTHVDRIRSRAGISTRARVVTRNSFPTSTGIASSASGFAALTLAGCHASGMDVSEKELSILARLGSGSACRSIPRGFAEWKKGSGMNDSYSYSLCEPGYWDLRDIIMIVQTDKKEVPTTDAHRLAPSSPFFSSRLTSLPKRIRAVKDALRTKDIVQLGSAMEQEALNMHAVMMTTDSPSLYMTGKTIDVIRAIWHLRRQGIEAYVTLDAGPNVHVLCEADQEQTITDYFRRFDPGIQMIVNRPGEGTYVSDGHLF